MEQILRKSCGNPEYVQTVCTRVFFFSPRTQEPGNGLLCNVPEVSDVTVCVQVACVVSACETCTDISMIMTVLKVAHVQSFPSNCIYCVLVVPGIPK